ncbi:MAG: DUF4249 family protein [Bacteroidia bacterium]
MEINSNLKYLFIIALMLCLYCLVSCQKDDSVADYQRPVVEGYLTPGNSVEIKVYYQKYLEDTLSYGYPITGLSLRVSDGSNNVLLSETKPGVYTYADNSFVKENKRYSLSFTHLNKAISAETVIPPKPVNFRASSTQQQVPVFSPGSTPSTFVPVAFSWSNPELFYHLLSFQNIEAYPSSISRGTALKTEILVEQAATYQTDQLNFNYAGNYKVLLFRINKEYNDALKNSSGNSLNLTNPSTNIVNGLGIFTGLNPVSLNLYVYQ